MKIQGFDTLLMHHHPRQLEIFFLFQRAFRQGVLTTPLLEALGEKGEKFGLLGKIRYEKYRV